jgi:hypothetical protein
VPGTFDFATGNFVTNGGNWATATAAQAHGSATVNNLVAPVFGASFLQSTVDRDATAAISGVCSPKNLLPIALTDCAFNAFATANDCSTLPQLIQAPDGADNSCWTTLTPNQSGGSTIDSYLPTACGGGGVPTPPVVIGQRINVTNGQVNSVLKDVGDCFNQGLKEWDIPLIDCNTKCGGQGMTVTGFAHIVITSVKSNGSPKYIQVNSICKTDPDSRAGCVNKAGLTGLTLVK